MLYAVVPLQQGQAVPSKAKKQLSHNTSLDPEVVVETQQYTLTQARSPPFFCHFTLPIDVYSTPFPFPYHINPHF